MRLAVRLSLHILAAAFGLSVPVHAQNYDDDLKVYGVSVINLAPFFPFRMYGVFLGDGAVLTAAHVVGHWPLFTTPRIIIAGQELSAKVIKKGSFPELDLALLSVDDASLPMSLQLRRNPLCKTQPNIGANVIVVYPERTVRSQIISPNLVASNERKKFNTLIKDVESSGSGAFDVERKCLLGIMSASVPYQKQNKRAGYFVPASKIADFVPIEYRF
jgi:hypothetical protein